MERDPDVTAIERLLDELAAADGEHPDVALSDASGWTLSAFPGGRVVFENVEADDARHLAGVARGAIADLMRALATGDLDVVDRQPWQPGYERLTRSGGSRGTVPDDAR